MKITIVGGGSSGWMTAAALIKTFKNFEITVIESPNIQRIGVGESTYDGIQYFIKYLDIDINDFFKKTDASIKLAIKFKNFFSLSKNDEFIYPFGIADTNGTLLGIDDWYIKKYLYPDTEIFDLAESYFPAASLIKYNTFNENKYNELGNFNPELYSALHFDAIKFADWLKNNYCLPNGVVLIENEVIEVLSDESGIKKLLLLDGTEHSADLYIDCTGFKGLLINETINTKFISYSEVLPNDSAWATQLEYIDKENELTPITTSTALKNGWVWNIPLWSRIGTGYVYSSKYISDEDALDEFKNYLIDENPKRDKKTIDSLVFKKIKMRVGINEKVWNKNVVAIGLSAGFIEPLESNGLFTVHEFIYELIRSLSRENPTQFDIDTFNQRTHSIFNSFVEFIRMHYYLSQRTDSKYWKDITNSGYIKSNIYDTNYESNHYERLIKAKTFDFSAPNHYGIIFISAGMHYFFIDNLSARLGEIENNIDYKNYMNKYFSNIENKKKKWNLVAKNSPKYIDYLYKKFYS